MEKGKLQRKKWKQENLEIWQEITKYGKKAQRPEIPWQIIGTGAGGAGAEEARRTQGTHPTLGYLSRQLPHNSFVSTYGSWLARDLKEQSQTAYVGIKILG